MKWKTKFAYYSLDTWHPWYAWFPVRVSKEKVEANYKTTFFSEWVWLQYVDRWFIYEGGCDGGRVAEYAKLGTHTGDSGYAMEQN